MTLHRKLTLITLFVLILPFAVSGAKVTVTPAEKADHQLIRQMFSDKMPGIELEINDFIQKYPKSPFLAEVLYVSAQNDLNQNKTEAAVQGLNRIIQKHAGSPYKEDSLFLVGKIEFNNNQYDQAVKILQQLLLEHPTTKFKERTWYHLALIAFQKRDWQQVSIYKDKIKRNYLLRQAQKDNLVYIESWLADQKGDLKRAKAFALKYIHSQPEKNDKSAILWLKLGDYRKFNKEWVKARINYENALKAAENKSTELLAKFWISEMIFAVHQENPKRISDKLKKQAIRDYSVVIQSELRKKEHAPALYHRGWLHIYFNQEKQAVNDFSRLQKLDPKFAADLDLYFIQSSYWEKQKGWKKAVSVLDKALTQDWKAKNQIKLRLNLIRNLVSLSSSSDQCSRILKQIDLLKTPLPKKSKDELYSYQGNCFYKQKNWQSATLAYSQVDLKSAAGPFIFSSFLNSLEKLKDYHSAAELLKTIEKDKRYGKPYDLLSERIRYLFLLKQWKTAVSELHRYGKLAPNYVNRPKIQLQFATGYENLGQMDRAAPFYFKAFKQLNKKDKDLKLSIADKLGSYYEKAGKQKALVTVYTDILPLLNEKTKKDTLILFIGKTWYLNLKKSDQGAAWFQKLHLQGNTDLYYEGSYLLGEIQINNKQFKQAVKTLEQLSKQKIRNTRWYLPVHYRLGELYQVQEKWKKAIEHYKLVSKTPDDTIERKNARTHLYNIRKYLKQIQNDQG